MYKRQITGCDSPDYTASIKESFSSTDTMAPTDTSDDIVSTGEALSEEDVLVDVSSLSIPEYSGTDFYVVNDNVPFFNEKIKAYPGTALFICRSWMNWGGVEHVQDCSPT